ncbi:HSF-type DNA-binding-domain-containing protein [Schizophyllum amplum]|uniref:HSF-type DNA-binding-domain-containing protein n=1 Tax=Schizophyllum amplum TaxID=97359 RepID=A0A550C1V6_9AGAR|nr:HSF-type DNA-binding-domain-containing protein [Auriculariopsis ampla]
MAPHFHYVASDVADADMAGHLHTSACDPPSRIYLEPPSTSPAASGSRPSTASSLGYHVKHNSSDTEADSAYEDGSSMTLISGTDDSFQGSTSGTRTPPDLDNSHGGEDGIFGGSGGLGVPSGMVGNSGMNTTRPAGSNNFVSKLYQMISDPKSANFIAWTDLGTSFVVSNVGEFSRSILGSHFKHNNFSSFVRQLNMYGFHKINRTPRAQRTSTDQQVWEFSHHKFLRGRPDLLDEIKRKALEPDPSIKHRVELPGEVAAQLNAMRDENRRVWEQLATERRRAENLIGVVGQLWDIVGKGFPGQVPPFPLELLDGNESPAILVTSPPTGEHVRYNGGQPQNRYAGSEAGPRYVPPIHIPQPPLHAMHTLAVSPTSSPTGAEFPAYHSHAPSPLSSGGMAANAYPYARAQQSYSAPESTVSMSPHGGLPPMASHAMHVDMYHDGGPRAGMKRPRLAGDDADADRRMARTRCDSAPLGYGYEHEPVQNHHLGGWEVRPRSDSEYHFDGGERHPGMGLPTVPNVPTLNRCPPPPGQHGPPMLLPPMPNVR